MIKHWYYFGETVLNSGRVKAACGKYVMERTEIDYNYPTCDFCKQALREYDMMEVDKDVKHE